MKVAISSGILRELRWVLGSTRSVRSGLRRVKRWREYKAASTAQLRQGWQGYATLGGLAEAEQVEHGY